MLAVNGYSPYSAVYGRVPNILPSIDQVAPPVPTVTRHSFVMLTVSAKWRSRRLWKDRRGPGSGELLTHARP